MIALKFLKGEQTVRTGNHFGQKIDTCSFVVLILVPYKQQVQSATKTQSKVSKGSTRGC